MAITTWTELKAAVADFAHRSDLTTQIPDFITLAEARLFDMLLLRNMEAETNLTSSIGVNYIALPTGYVSPIALWLTINSIRQLLLPALPQELPYIPSNGVPQYWAVDADNVRLDRPADAVYTLPFRYIKTANLGASVATNELLARRPDVYLAGSLSELARYTQNDKLFNIWEPRFLTGCAELKAVENRNRAIAPLRSDIPTSPRTGNIIRGE